MEHIATSEGPKTRETLLAKLHSEPIQLYGVVEAREASREVWVTALIRRDVNDLLSWSEYFMEEYSIEEISWAKFKELGGKDVLNEELFARLENRSKSLAGCGGWLRSLLDCFSSRHGKPVYKVQDREPHG